MHNNTWIDLIRLIPEKYYGKLMLMTISGVEINLQGLYRLEPEYIVLRGRLAGTLDAGSVLFVPYDQINYLGFREEIKETEVQAMFGGPTSGTETKAAVTPAESPPPPQVQEAAPPPAPSPTTLSTAPLPGKAALLERLRKSRLGQDPSKPTGGT